MSIMLGEARTKIGALPLSKHVRPGAIWGWWAGYRDRKAVSVVFDTLEFARTWRDKAKLSSEQAEGISEAFAEASSEPLATKTDVKRQLRHLQSVKLRTKGLVLKAMMKRGRG